MILITTAVLESIIGVVDNSGLTSQSSGKDLYQPFPLSVFLQDDKDGDACEEEELVGNGTNNSAERKRQLWWKSQQGTDEKNVSRP